MIHLPASVRVYLCLRACDMRKSFDGLHALVREDLELDAFAGHLFVFASRYEFCFPAAPFRFWLPRAGAPRKAGLLGLLALGSRANSIRVPETNGQNRRSYVPQQSVADPLSSATTPKRRLPRR